MLSCGTACYKNIFVLLLESNRIFKDFEASAKTRHEYFVRRKNK